MGPHCTGSHPSSGPSLSNHWWHLVAIIGDLFKLSHYLTPPHPGLLKYVRSLQACGMHPTGKLQQFFYYRPETKTMFLYLSVILFMEGGDVTSCCRKHPPEQHPPDSTTPPGQHHSPPQPAPPPDSTSPFSQQAVGMHPTGMLSCFQVI